MISDMQNQYMSDYRLVEGPFVTPLVSSIIQENGQQKPKPAYSKEEFNRNLDIDTRYRWVHVPYSMVEVVWDFVDTCHIISSSKTGRMPEVKSFIRRLRQLKQDVDYRHKHCLSNNGRKWGEEDAINMQETVFGDMFGEIRMDLTENLKKTYPEDSEDGNVFWCCAHTSRLLAKGTASYMKEFMDRFKKKFGLTVKDILCREFYDTINVLTDMCRIHPIGWSDEDDKEYVSAIVKCMFSLEFRNDEGVLQRVI